MKVLFATRQEAPGIDPDDHPLADALMSRGVEVRPAVWSDPSINWATADLCLIRSTWDYHRRLPEFLAWAERVSRSTRLWNELTLVRWNVNKRYLEDIRQAGVPVVPTVWLQRGSTVDLARVLDDRGWSDAVIKPTVSADSFGTLKVRRSKIQYAQATLDRLLVTDDMMVQPFFNSVERTGERSLIFIAGEYTHTIRRGDVFGQMIAPFELIEVSAPEQALARSALDAVGRPVHYARVDVVDDDTGAPVLMELELVEPSLFLPRMPSAADRFADHIVKKLR